MPEADPNPLARRRRTDRGWRRLIRENAYRDAWLLIITIIALFAIVLGNHENQDRITDIQRERAHALMVICRETNAHNAAIVAFIKSSVPKARLKDPRVKAYLAHAEHAFPLADCVAVVRRTVKQ